MSITSFLSTNVDQSIYYQLHYGMRRFGWIDPSGNSIVTIVDEDVTTYALTQAEEQQVSLDTYVGSNLLPAIAIQNEEEQQNPFALGGTNSEERFYRISVFGNTYSESKEMASAVLDIFASGVYVYDFNRCAPDASGFPLSGQYIGRFETKDRRNRKNNLPSYSLLDSLEREVSFRVVNFRHP